MKAVYDVIIVGSGPAGLTAGLNTCRAKLSTLILEKEVMGGELMARELIENYPGYPDGIMGPELGSNMLNQVMNYGAEIRLAEVQGINVEGNQKIVKTSQGEFYSKSIIIASGCHPKKLGVPGEEEFAEKGVFYCATCDGPNYSQKVVAVAGGGDAGITEALSLARIASRIIVIELLPRLSASKILQERAASNSAIEIKCGFKIKTIQGNERVERVGILDMQTGQKSILNVDGVLVHVGIEPNTDYLQGILPLNEKGQIIVNERMATETPGIFAAGDVQQNSPCQISTAVGDGAIAALSLEKYVSQL